MSGSDDSPLAASQTATRLPAQDLGRGRQFYSDRLGLEPADGERSAWFYDSEGNLLALGQPLPTRADLRA